MPGADAMFAMDWKWWREYGAAIPPGPEMWTASGHAAKVMSLNFMATETGGGVSRRPGVIRDGGNSGFCAVGLALLFGARRVVLVGYDMQPTAGRLHWHADHDEKLLGNPDIAKFRTWRKRFDEMASELPAGVEIVNATRDTALTCFPRKSFDACFPEPSPRRAGTTRRVRARA